ncbi:glycosyltransferase family 39 protein, partial [bacterium]|nr:glycosyltransferase family 39 protein [candidate division CSSED10-310 bacterium]
MKDFRGWDAVPDLVLILVITLVTICLLIVHVPVVYFGDAANNLAYSRHLIRTGQWAFTAHSDGQPHIPSTFVTTDNVHFHVRYPPGSMLVFATAELVCGEWGLRATNLLFGIAGIVLFYRTLLLLFPRWFAAAGAIALLLTPAYLFFMASYMTHPLSMFFILGAFYLVVRAPESNHPAWFAASAGLCIGAAVATRYINILILPLLGLSVIVPLFQDGKPRIRSLVVPMFGRAAGFALGAGVVMILLACYHTVQFGGPFITGYELAGETSPFNLRHFSSNLPNVTTLFLNYSGIAVPLALMGIYRLIRRGNILRLVVLVGWMSQFLL